MLARMGGVLGAAVKGHMSRGSRMAAKISARSDAANMTRDHDSFGLPGREFERLD
jgi:hypothetical protein